MPISVQCWKCIGDDLYWAHVIKTELAPKNSLKATSPSKKASWYESVVGESLLCRQEVDVFFTQQWPMDGLRWPRWQGGKERKGPQEINHPKAPPVDWKEGGPPLWHGQVVVYPPQPQKSIYVLFRSYLGHHWAGKGEKIQQCAKISSSHCRIHKSVTKLFWNCIIGTCLATNLCLAETSN